MTVNQYKKKIEVARKLGKADLGGGSALEYDGLGSDWRLVSTWKCSPRSVLKRNVVDVSYDPMKFSYICE